MKNIFKNPILMFILGAIIFSEITAYAAIKYQANEIEYNDTPLNEVLDDLYEKSEGTQFIKRACAYGFGGMLDLEIYLPDLTDYKVLKINKATMGSGTPLEFKLRDSGNIDYANFNISNDPQEIDISNISGTGYKIFLYSRNVSEWSIHCIEGVTLSK